MILQLQQSLLLFPLSILHFFAKLICWQKPTLLLTTRSQSTDQTPEYEEKRNISFCENIYEENAGYIEGGEGGGGGSSNFIFPVITPFTWLE